MATFTFKPHAGFIKAAMNKEIDLADDSLYAMISTVDYVPNLDTHEYKSSVTNEITGTGYAANGQALAGVTWTYNSSTNLWTLDANDVTWPDSTLTGRVVTVYSRTPASDATRPIIGTGIFSENVISNAGPFAVRWGAAGLFTIQLPT